MIKMLFCESFVLNHLNLSENLLKVFGVGTYDKQKKNWSPHQWR